MKIRDRIDEFALLFPGRDTERWIRAIAEEAGEVLGAYNKWQDGNRVKPKTRDDVLEEMAQLLGCVLVTADRLGVPFGEFMELVDGFLGFKAAQIKAIREGTWISLVSG